VDPAPEPGRTQAVVDLIQGHVTRVAATPAAENDLLAVHTKSHADDVERMVLEAAKTCGGGCFGILPGGYNHRVLGHDLTALIEGLSGA